MLKFKQYIVEYLTDEQRARYKQYKMTPKARRDTDHFFGKGVDEVHGEIANDDKSEIHTRLENHLGQPVSHEDYKRGAIKDKYGRDVKIGRLIKDSSLRNQFDQDPSRKLERVIHKTRTVRGTEVAGQTNPVPDANHPTGHSWHDSSCKNLESGINRHYLPKEIQHGTVVHFVHDSNGQEIYRATLQPHHNESGRVAYSVDAEYGIKHPHFTADAHRVATALSGQSRGNIVHEKHDDVYNDNGEETMIHPKASDAQLMKHLKTGNWSTKYAVLKHPNLNHKHLMQAVKDEDEDNVMTALSHPNITHEHIEKAMNRPDASDELIGIAASNPKATLEQLQKGLSYRSASVRYEAMKSPNVTPDMLSKLQDDKDRRVRSAVIKHPNADVSHLNRAINDHDWMVRAAVARNSKAQPHHLDQLVNDEDSDVVHAASNNRNLSADHITKIMKSPFADAKKNVLYHNNFNPSHLGIAIHDKDPEISMLAATNHRDMLTPEHLEHLADHNSWRVRHTVAKHELTPIKTLKKLTKDEDPDVVLAAGQNLKNSENRK
jgi:hypothetical protein